jgi:hypothetical protein
MPVPDPATAQRHSVTLTGGMMGGRGMGSRGPVPRKQFVEAIDRVTFDEAGEDVGEIGLRIDAIEFADLDERGVDRPMLATAVRAREQRILFDSKRAGEWHVRRYWSQSRCGHHQGSGLIQPNATGRSGAPRRLCPVGKRRRASPPSRSSELRRAALFCPVEHCGARLPTGRESRVGSLSAMAVTMSHDARVRG